jgi:WD40 repeat protein
MTRSLSLLAMCVFVLMLIVVGSVLALEPLHSRYVLSAVLATQINPNTGPTWSETAFFALIDIDREVRLDYDTVPPRMNAAEFSPDGRRVLVFTSTPYREQQALHLLDLRTSQTAQSMLPGRQDGSAPRFFMSYSPMWSPDSQQVMFTHSAESDRNGLFVLDLRDGRTETIVPHAQTFRHAGWSPNGEDIAYESDGEVVAIIDGQQRTLGPGRTPAWSADGSRIAYIDGDRILIWSGGAVQTITPATETIALLHWSPSGNWLAFLAEDDTFYTVDVETLAQYRVGDGRVRWVSWADDDNQIALEMADGTLILSHPTGSPSTQISDSGTYPRWSRQSRYMLYDVREFTETGVEQAVYAVRPPDEPAILTPGLSSLVWSRDDARVAVQNPGLRVMDAASRETVYELPDRLFVLDFAFFD